MKNRAHCYITSYETRLVQPVQPHGRPAASADSTCFLCNEYDKNVVEYHLEMSYHEVDPDHFWLLKQMRRVMASSTVTGTSAVFPTFESVG